MLMMIRKQIPLSHSILAIDARNECRLKIKLSSAMNRGRENKLGRYGDFAMKRILIYEIRFIIVEAMPENKWF